jgi:hypothetical protein
MVSVANNQQGLRDDEEEEQEQGEQRQEQVEDRQQARDRPQVLIVGRQKLLEMLTILEREFKGGPTNKMRMKV